MLRINKLTPTIIRFSSTFPSTDNAINLDKLNNNSPLNKIDNTSNSSERFTGYLYFDSIFPITLGLWDLRRYLVKLDEKVSSTNQPFSIIYFSPCLYFIWRV